MCLQRRPYGHRRRCSSYRPDRLLACELISLPSSGHGDVVSRKPGLGERLLVQSRPPINARLESAPDHHSFISSSHQTQVQADQFRIISATPRRKGCRGKKPSCRGGAEETSPLGHARGAGRVRTNRLVYEPAGVSSLPDDPFQSPPDRATAFKSAGECLREREQEPEKRMRREYGPGRNVARRGL